MQEHSAICKEGSKITLGTRTLLEIQNNGPMIRTILHVHCYHAHVHSVKNNRKITQVPQFKPQKMESAKGFLVGPKILNMSFEIMVQFHSSFF